MSPVIDLNIHHLSEQPTVTLIKGCGPFVALELSAHPAQATLFLSTPAECDALILAAVTAKDLLLAATARPPMCDATTPTATGYNVYKCTLDAGHDGDHKAGGAGVTWPQPAPLPKGHGPNHIDNAGHATLACDGECHPGTCAICGGHYEGDRSHVSTISGAVIPAEPVQVST